MDSNISLAIALRAFLLLFGAWQDSHLAVKYTDIDYAVYTDAAHFVVAGGSPYDRSTYRYSPLLAILMTPNVLVHKSFGKVLFAMADILAAKLMQRLLRRRGASSRAQSLGIAIWLFSPFTVTISTRGNGEALVTCMLLGMLELLEGGHVKLSGLLFGLAVHWRVYPIIYALPVMRFLAMITNNNSETNTSHHPSIVSRVKSAFKGVVSWSGLKFAIPSALMFLSLGSGLYYLYGFPFLHETYLYHTTRTDPRHNFSPYFYPAYLATGVEGKGGWVTAVIGDSGRVFSLAGLVLQIALGLSFAGNLPAAFMLQTVALVAFNKVATAQYFVWYLSWLPLVLPNLRHARNKWRLGKACLAWTGSLAHWLTWAYLLEFQGWAVHLQVWVAGLLWVLANAMLLKELVLALKARYSDEAKKDL